MKFWKPAKDAHIVYEAATAILDGRVKKVNEGEYNIFSSSGNKFYTLNFLIEGRGEAAPQNIKIMSDDNMAYFRKEVSYPMLIVLMQEKIINIILENLSPLVGIKWKDVNTKNKNDYMKSVSEVLENLQMRGEDVGLIKTEVAKVWEELKGVKIEILGGFTIPSKNY